MLLAVLDVIPCILPIILHYYSLLFPGLLRKDCTALKRALKIVNKMCGESFDAIMNMLIYRHLKSCKQLASVILSTPFTSFSMYVLW